MIYLFRSNTTESGIERFEVYDKNRVLIAFAECRIDIPDDTFFFTDVSNNVQWRSNAKTFTHAKEVWNNRVSENDS